MSITLEDIRAAATLISGHVLDTPCLHSRTLSELTGADVWLKFENLQFTASFKERGALVKLAALSDDQRRKGVIAASAGNHAQGVAYHAKRLSINAVFVMPRCTAPSKSSAPAHLAPKVSPAMASTMRAIMRCKLDRRWVSNSFTPMTMKKS